MHTFYATADFSYYSLNRNYNFLLTHTNERWLSALLFKVYNCQNQNAKKGFLQQYYKIVSILIVFFQMQLRMNKVQINPFCSG